MLLSSGLPVRAAAPRTLALRADVLVVRDGGRTVEARGNVRLSDGRSTVRADRARYVVRDRLIELAGQVTMATAQGTLEAQEARLQLGRDQRIDTVDAAGQASLETRHRVLQADRIHYEVSSERLAATGRVSLFIPPDLIASGRELVMRGRERAVLSGRAKIASRDGYLEGDRLEVSETAQTADLRGSVVGAFEDVRIAAATASFSGTARTVVFRGDVVVTRPGRTIRADVVTVFYRERRLVAEGQTYLRLEDAPGAP